MSSNELKQLAAKFGMSVDEAQGYMREAHESFDDVPASKVVHPSHRVRELEPDSSFGRSRRQRLTYGD